MTGTEDTREVIPGGKQPFLSFDHLVPIAKFLVQERGHRTFPKEPAVESFDWGFMIMNGIRCRLTRRITEEDWAAINERFLLPSTITYNNGLIRDNLHRIQIEGIERIKTEDGTIPIEEWEEHQRALGKMS